MNLEQTVRIARGDALADLALRNGSLINVSTGEIYITDVLWPEFGPAQLDEAIEAYRSRERRFGRTGEQARQVAG